MLLPVERAGRESGSKGCELPALFFQAPQWRTPETGDGRVFVVSKVSVRPKPGV